jgi:diguanylate cyclase (GGDEF)-like protein/PAS domain S-box-containing protein
MKNSASNRLLFLSEYVIFPSMIIAGVVFVILAVFKYTSFDEQSKLNETAANQAMLDIGYSAVDDINRVVIPAMERTRMLANSPELIRSMESGSQRNLTAVCNQAMRESTEVDAIALFNAKGEIVALNTIYADGTEIDQERINKVLSMDYQNRDIITNCLNNDAKVDVLEFQTTCDITPALFDSTGLSVAYSTPVYNSNGEQIGLVSMRLEFSRLTRIIQNRTIAGDLGTIYFVTDTGGYFDEQINSGIEHPPIPNEILHAITSPLIEGGSNHVVLRRKSQFHSLFRNDQLKTLNGGGIQLMVSVPGDWLLKEIRTTEQLNAGMPGAVGILLLTLSGMVFFAIKGERRRIAVERSSIDLEQANLSMKDAQERFELAIHGSRDVIFDLNLDKDHLFIASNWVSLVGEVDYETDIGIEYLYSRICEEDRAAVRNGIDGFVNGLQETYDTKFRMNHVDGSKIWVMLRAAAIISDTQRIRRVSGSLADISELKSIEEELRTVAQTDALTGLWARSVVGDRVDEAISECKKSNQACAVLFFDFDRFKIVNDSLGHDVGDELLKSIAGRIKCNIRNSDTAARMGGDEFVVLLDKLSSPEQAKEIANEILVACSLPHSIAGHQVVSTASIGMVTDEHGYSCGSEMIRDADAAMYQAKAHGRNCVVEFDKKMHEEALERLSLGEDLYTAENNGEFELHYQPIIKLENGMTVGAEALIRWNHPGRGLVSPAEFIPIAEETGLIKSMGSWVLNEACRQLADWKKRDVVPDGFTININVAKQQLLNEEFFDELVESVSANGLSPADIKVEVTETTIVDNRANIASVLEKIRRHSFHVVMDDFGTGHSSLSGIHTLPISEMKIDQSFVKLALVDPSLIKIITAIISLSDNLSLPTVGEGIESIDQVTLLLSMGCEFGQGFYFSKPLESAQFEEYSTGSKSSRVA